MSAIRRMESEDWDLIERVLTSAIHTNVPPLDTDDLVRAMWIRNALLYAHETHELLSEPSSPTPSRSP